MILTNLKILKLLIKKQNLKFEIDYIIIKYKKVLFQESIFIINNINIK